MTSRWPIVAAALLLGPWCAPFASAQGAGGGADYRTARPLPTAVTPPPGFQRAVQRGTRTATGAPGPRYWQQWSDYRISATLDAAQKRLTGTAQITYRNRSPDTLSSVYLHLYTNYSQPGGRRNDPTGDAAEVTLTRVAVNGQPLGEAATRGATGYSVDGTILRIRLPRPLLPGASLPLDIGWSNPIPRNADERTGWDADNLFLVAYFYPQMAVYDDVSGWNLDPYLGQAEFYMGYASYDVTIDAPEGWVVAGTGELQNPEEVLPAEVLRRLAQARASDQVVHVLTAADFGPGRATRDVPGDRLRWHFRADSVRDFTFSATRESLWDAVRAPVGDRNADGRPDHTLVEALYRAGAPGWGTAAEAGRHSVDFISRFTGLPYPWPHMTLVEGNRVIGGGMEYPMMSLIGGTRSDTSLYSVTVHEIAHMWVPMIVGAHETRYGWMDEGMTNFTEANAVRVRFPGGEDPLRENQDTYLAVARAGGEGEMMRWSDFHYSSAAYVVASYYKPTSVLFALRSLLGEEMFQRGYQAFLHRWAYRHPMPWDFFNAMEAAAGRDLDWFWSSWFYTTWTLDQAVGSVAADAGGTTVTVRDLGMVPMPARVRVTRENGETTDREVPVETWLSGARTATVRFPSGSPVVRVEIDPAGAFPDVDRANNLWTRQAPSLRPGR